MVVFTCNNCGDSLQKPKVEKHYQFTCRRGKNLTCVDCHKDFLGEEYAVHTKCVTEEERYAAKGSLPNGVVKKGEVKQQSWVEMINSILHVEQNLAIGPKKLLQYIAQSPNCPRKKNKFFNFLKSSSGYKANINDMEVVWGIIEKHKEANKPAENGQSAPKSNEENGKRKLEDEDDNSNKKVKTNDEENQNATDEPVNKKKKKKNKDKQAVENTNDEQANENVTVDKENEEGTKKKRKNKKHNLNGEQSNVDVNTSENVLENKDSLENKRKIEEVENGANEEVPKKKKKKNKKAKSEDNSEQTNIELNGEETLPSEKNEKKQNPAENNNEQLDIAESNTDAQMNGKENASEDTQDQSVKKKNKKNKKAALENNVKHEENGKDTKQVNETDTKNLFSYKDSILSVLNNKREIPLKKLEKKVIGEYLKHNGETIAPEKQIKKFHKKLKSLEGVVLENDIVKLQTK